MTLYIQIESSSDGGGFSEIEFLLESLHAFLLIAVWELVEGLLAVLIHMISEVVVVVTSDPPGKVHVFLHDCDSFGMKSTQVSIFKDTSEVSFGRFLESDESLCLEAEFRVNVPYNLTH